MFNISFQLLAGGQTNGVTMGLIREVSGDETIILLISRNGGELASMIIGSHSLNTYKHDTSPLTRHDLIKTTVFLVINPDLFCSF
jgi:hypothetical protein